MASSTYLTISSPAIRPSILVDQVYTIIYYSHYPCKKVSKNLLRKIKV